MRFARVGDIDIGVAIHGRGTAPPRFLFPDIPADALTAALAPHLDDHGDIEFVYSSVVVKLGEHVVVLDAGPAAPHGSGSSSLVRLLNDAGVDPTDVGIVVISHGHDDHVGGLTDDSSAAGITFANARHYLTTAEFEHWTSRGGGESLAARNFARVEAAGALTLVDGEHEVLPGLTLLPAPGHTPGHLATVIDSRRDRVLYVGDVLAHQVNVPHPDWNHFSDMLAGPARRTRQAVVERAAEGNHVVVASHVPVVGRVRAVDGGRELVSSGDVGDVANN